MGCFEEDYTLPFEDVPYEDGMTPTVRAIRLRYRTREIWREPQEPSPMLNEDMLNARPDDVCAPSPPPRAHLVVMCTQSIY